MKLIYPTVELWEQTDKVTHVTKCARVCYASESDNPDANLKLVNSLESKGHLSMFRHESRYFIVRKNNNPEVYATLYQILREFKYCPFMCFTIP